VLAILVAAGGCATQRDTVALPDLGGWAARTGYLAAADDFEFAARIGVKTADDGFNGKLRWIQQGAAFEATVGGPLGVGTVRIEGEGDAVVLIDNEGARTELRDVETDLLLRYGWTIPVSSLRYWALGIPDPEAPAETRFHADGLLESLEQRGWTVVISSYRDGGAGQPMPYRLSASNADTRVRIVIDKWLFFE
jgi:outer membrane lipoprotein LolB